MNNNLEGMKVLLPAAVIIVLLLVACSSPVSKQQILTPPLCPLPVQQCRPEAGEVRVIDTGLTDKPWYYEIIPVSGINTPANEWTLWFWTPDTVYATVERNGKQQLQQYRVAHYDRFHLVDNLILPYRHYGSATGDKRRRWIAYAAVAPTAFRFDSDVLIAADATWEKAKSLSFDQQPHWDSHPALDPEGKALFFASDRGDTIHGTELWFSVWLGERWSEPLTVGPVINTDCDELTPFVTPDRQWLLFASTGHRNVGGYDLFRSRIHPEFWAAVDQRDLQRLQDSAFLVSVFDEPENLGKPINTIRNELFPYTPASPDSLLYYASDQGKRADFDIYVFVKHRLGVIAAHLPQTEEVKDTLSLSTIEVQPVEIPQFEQSEEKDTVSVKEAVVQGQVVDPDRQPVPDARVSALVEDTLYARTWTDTVGNFSVSVPQDQPVVIEAEAPGYFPKRTTIVATEDTVQLADTAIRLQHFTIVRIHFPTDQYRHPYPYVLDDNGFPTNETWQHLLDRVARSILQDTSILQQVLIVGHTDDVASEQYNYQLGLRRANFVYEQLYQRGVPLHLMKILSKGELEKLPRKPGEPLKLYRKRLRRVEIIKVVR